KRHYERQFVETQAQAQALVALWLAQEYDHAQFWAQPDGRFQVWGLWAEPYITTPPGTTMPRGKPIEYYTGYDPKTYQPYTTQAPDWIGRLKLDLARYCHADPPPASARPRLERFRLFSVPTRQYLRRRAWRYFRRLGKVHPERYVSAVSEALALYEDGDVSD